MQIKHKRRGFCVVSASPSLLAKITSSTQIVLCSHRAGKTASEGGLTFRPHRSAARSPSSPPRSQTSAAAKVKEARERVHKRKEEERRSTCTSQRQGRELCRTFSRFDSFATVTHFNVVQELLFPAPYVGQLIPLLQRKVFRYWEEKKKNTEQELREFEMDVFEGGARFK